MKKKVFHNDYRWREKDTVANDGCNAHTASYYGWSEGAESGKRITKEATADALYYVREFLDASPRT